GRTAAGIWMRFTLTSGSMAAWYGKHPKDTPVPFALEKVGEPSKVITLRALQVIERLEDSG
ncbi:MAG: hypothetical protein OK474_12245, partial [Thaumarchaeota archaeon]|nr:hypothetical protein [Nitrososphaerota archaeon]